MESVRTCVGCRRRDSPGNLLRVVHVDGEVVADAAATSPGRGAWVHPASDCVSNAIRRRAFGRALRVEGRLSTDRLRDRFAPDPGSDTSPADRKG
jgi:uncharacterized protein